MLGQLRLDDTLRYKVVTSLDTFNSKAWKYF